MNRNVSAGTALLLAVAACGVDTTHLAATPSVDTEYRARSAFVLEAGEGAQLCLGGIETSLPPQCGGPLITNWDWSDVDGEERRSGTSWGAYDVVGTYDGERFRLTRPPLAPTAQPNGGATPSFPTVCAVEPEGSDVPDGSRISEDDVEATVRAASGEPDAAGVWLTYTQDPVEGSAARGTVVVNAAFTGDLERHEAALRAVWGGWLCVTRYEHTESRLRDIQDALQQESPALGLTMLGSGVDIVRQRVELTVILSTAEQRARIAERYDGLVDITDALQPVS